MLWYRLAPTRSSRTNWSRNFRPVITASHLDSNYLSFPVFYPKSSQKLSRLNFFQSIRIRCQFAADTFNPGVCCCHIIDLGNTRSPSHSFIPYSLSIYLSLSPLFLFPSLFLSLCDFLVSLSYIFPFFFLRPVVDLKILLGNNLLSKQSTLILNNITILAEWNSQNGLFIYYYIWLEMFFENNCFNRFSIIATSLSHN